VPKAPDHIIIKPDQMYAVVESITADHAQRILDEANVGTATLRQRRASESVVNDYVGVIERGEWLPVPPGIVYDTDHRLLNGQQRLLAQVRTGRTLPWWVTYNCPAAVFSVIDTHKKRTVGDALYMAGAVDVSSLGTHLGSSLRLLACYERAAAEPDGMRAWTGWTKQRMSNTQILSGLQRHPNIGVSLTTGYRVRAANPAMNIASTTVWHRIVCDAYPESAEHVEAFADQIAYGRMIDRGYPAYTLRGWLGRGMPAGGDVSTYRMAREVGLFGLILAWNAYATHRELTAIAVSTRKPMPLPVAWVPPRNRGEGSGRS
jgi:hypothetical protein